MATHGDPFDGQVAAAVAAAPPPALLFVLSLPVWPGAMAAESVTLFGHPKQTATAGPAAVHGDVAMMIAGYALDRDTGVGVRIMPDFVTAIGPLDRDIKTGSVAFKARFTLRMAMADGTVVGHRTTVELLRVSTPAFQATLIDLADGFAARVIVDRDTAFVAGFRNLQTQDDTEMRGLVQDAIAAFAAAVSFKRCAA